MSYEHMMVATAVQTHKKMKERQSEQTEKVQGNHSFAVYDGLLISHTFASYLAEVEKAFRGVKFYASSDLGGGWGSLSNDTERGSVWIPNRLYVAYPNDDYCMGTIGFGEFQSSTSNSVYMVGARTIKNEKYSYHNDNHHYALTADIKRSVKNAKTYLRPYTSKDFLAMSSKRAAQIFRAPVDRLRGAAYDTKNLVDDPRLYAELQRLHKSGFTFGDPKLQEHIAAWVSAEDTAAKEESRKAPACYVHIRKQSAKIAPEEQLVDCLEVGDMRERYLHTKGIDESLTPTTKKLTELHPDIAGKLAVLSMLADGDNVEGVGIRVTESVYWVEMSGDTDAVG